MINAKIWEEKNGSISASCQAEGKGETIVVEAGVFLGRLITNMYKESTDSIISKEEAYNMILDDIVDVAKEVFQKNLTKDKEENVVELLGKKWIELLCSELTADLVEAFYEDCKVHEVDSDKIIDYMIQQIF